MIDLAILLKTDTMMIILVVAIICSPILIILVPYITKDIEDIYKKKKNQKKEANIKADKLKLFDKNVERLQKLGKLYKDGIITKKEFEEKKKEFKI